MSFFDGTQPFRIDKPIRLIELFGGYGSQALALKYLGIPFEHWKMSEWAVKSIQAYKDLHAGDDDTDYSAGLTETEIKAWLLGRISSNYSEPLTEMLGYCADDEVGMKYLIKRTAKKYGVEL